MSTDDPDYQRRRDELISGLSMIDAIRAGRGTPAGFDLQASRLDALNGVAPPPGKPTAAPHLRVIRGGKV